MNIFQLKKQKKMESLNDFLTEEELVFLKRLANDGWEEYYPGWSDQEGIMYGKILALLDYLINKRQKSKQDE